MAAKTPLFARVLRSLRLAQAAAESRRGLDDVLEHWETRSAFRSRRAFLRGAAIATAGAVAACAAPVRRMDPGAAQVVVVGAGIAGLTAAYRLQATGVNVRLFEAQERVGGRIFSLRDRFADSQVVELGAELIDTGHTCMRHLATELGLKLDDLHAETQGLADAAWYFGGQRYSDRQVIDAFIPVAKLIDRDVATVRGAVTWRTPNGAEALDRMTLDEWFDQRGVSGWIRNLLDVAYTTEMGLDARDQSAWNMLDFISTQTDSFRIFDESDERFHTHGGNDQIVTELGTRLAAAIESASVLEALSMDADGRYRLSFRRNSGSQDVTATHVVLAIPLTTLRRVKLDVELPDVQRRAISSLSYGTNAKLMIGFAARPWRPLGSDGSTFTDLPFQSTWEASRGQSGAAGILTNFVGGSHGVEVGSGTEEEQAQQAVAALDRVFPGVAALREGMTQVRFHWPTHPWTQGSYLCCRPGDWTTYGGAVAEPVGRLRFAGEHCSSVAQGFMEGGCETGERVAAELLAEFGLQSRADYKKRRALFT